jgi:hypothetical protein
MAESEANMAFVVSEFGWNGDESGGEPTFSSFRFHRKAIDIEISDIAFKKRTWERFRRLDPGHA